MACWSNLKRADLLTVFWPELWIFVLCLSFKIFSLQTTHLRGKHLCDTALWIVLMKHFRQTTLCPHGKVRIVAFDAMHITHWKKKTQILGYQWSIHRIQKTSSVLNSFVLWYWICFYKYAHFSRKDNEKNCKW